MKEELRQFITKDMIRNAKYPLKDDEPLITGGLIDSFSLVELGLFIEEKFGVTVPDPDLTVANMDNLNLIVKMIESKQK